MTLAAMWAAKAVWCPLFLWWVFVIWLGWLKSRRGFGSMPLAPSSSSELSLSRIVEGVELSHLMQALMKSQWYGSTAASEWWSGQWLHTSPAKALYSTCRNWRSTCPGSWMCSSFWLLHLQWSHSWFAGLLLELEQWLYFHPFLDFFFLWGFKELLFLQETVVVVSSWRLLNTLQLLLRGQDSWSSSMTPLFSKTTHFYN